MPLNAEIKAMLEEYQNLDLPDFATLTPEQLRGELTKRQSPSDSRIPLAKIKGFIVPGPQGDIAIRVYWPQAQTPLPALLYFRGGGFVVGDLNSCDERCQLLSYFSGCIVVSVNYIQAPEHPFPAALEEGYAILQWIEQNVKKFGIKPDSIGVCGENSGGNIAASLCLMTRDREGPEIRYQLLIYPMLDNRLDSDSCQEFAEGYLLTRNMLQWYWQQYLPHDQSAENPYAVPARAQDLSHLPPAQIVTAEYDPLRDEGEAYANHLRDSGVRVNYHCYKGLVHGFLNMFGAVDKVNLVLSDITDKVKAVLL